MKASPQSARAGPLPPLPQPPYFATPKWARGRLPPKRWISQPKSASIRTTRSSSKSWSNHMVIYLPSQSVDEEPLLDELTPREIVRELDKHVVGQADAKRAVAIALRNRIRRQKLPPEMADEVMP